MKTLAENHWMPRRFRMFRATDCRRGVIRLRDDESARKVSPKFLIETEAATHKAVLKNIERFTLAGDFTSLM